MLTTTETKLYTSKLCYIKPTEKAIVKAYRLSLNNWSIPDTDNNIWDMVANSVAIYGKGNLRGVHID